MVRHFHSPIPVLSFLTVLLALVSAAESSPPAPAKQGPAKENAAGASAPTEHLSTTRHTILLSGTKLDYEATAGTLLLKDDQGKPQASIFFVAYTKVAGGPSTTRPVAFVFNGGPGSSSAWLHLGALGPQRVLFEEKGMRTAPPYHLVANEATLLNLTDLIFIDPVSTGFSRAAPGVEAKQFHGVQEDVKANAAFIRLYVTRFHRWDSPKFLIGESYGTTRAASLVEYLQDHDGMNFNGVILISTVLNFETISLDEGNDLPYILYLPSYTATAWYYKKLSADLQADRGRALAEAETWALGEYTLALMKGNSLSVKERDQLGQKLARYTGLSEEYARRSNWRIDPSRFRKELLRAQERTVGRFDTRFQGIDLDVVGTRPEYDPSYAVVQGPFTALINQYLQDELKYETDLTYRVLTDQVQPWNFGSAQNRYLNVAPALRQALTKNPHLHVLVVSGLYDLATPFLATRYTLSHLGLNASLADHLTAVEYPAGHMVYLQEESLRKLKADASRFLQGAFPAMQAPIRSGKE